MAANPLQNYFRQPKIFIDLPSKGIYNRVGTIDGPADRLPVYGMTGMDEIIAKTPDALLSGESSVKIIQSCCPSIKDGWDISTLDSELIFAAIKIATFGNDMTIGHVCKACGEINEYTVDLSTIIDHFMSCKYDNKIVIRDLIIKTKPFSYKQFTDFNIKNFELRQKLSQVENLESKEEQQESINALWIELAEIQRDSYVASIDSVQTTDMTVSERGYILEWIENCDKEITDAIKKQIENTKQKWNIPPMSVQCECGKDALLNIDLDYSNFFDNA
jgi:hypothetical protein